MPSPITTQYIRVMLRGLQRDNIIDASDDQIGSYIRGRLRNEGRTDEEVDEGTTIALDVVQSIRNPQSMQETVLEEGRALAASEHAARLEDFAARLRPIGGGVRSRKARSAKRSLRKKNTRKKTRKGKKTKKYRKYVKKTRSRRH